jgi:protein-ribulosamine 3-kinase
VNPALASRIGESIVQAGGVAFAPVRWEPVGGGCIHQAWKLVGREARGEREYFLKTNGIAAAPMFAAEHAGLDALRAAGTVRVPGAIARGDDGEHAWLALEWLELVALDGANAARLGTALAVQHRVQQPRFGWAEDNFIGATPQPNGWSDDWLEFWRHRRLVHQLGLAARNRLPSRLIDRGERLAADCGALFSGHSPRPALLHGDLWGGNAAVAAGEGPVVFDPAVYCGDREADVAMTALFGGFPADFGAAYRDAYPLPDGHAVRRDFYNLYHVLNHANLFGSGYVRQAQEAIERLLAQLS